MRALDGGPEELFNLCAKEESQVESSYPVRRGSRHLERSELLAAAVLRDDAAVEVLLQVGHHDAVVERVVDPSAVDRKLDEAVHVVPLHLTPPYSITRVTVLQWASPSGCGGQSSTVRVFSLKMRTISTELQELALSCKRAFLVWLVKQSKRTAAVSVKPTL